MRTEGTPDAVAVASAMAAGSASSAAWASANHSANRAKGSRPADSSDNGRSGLVAMKEVRQEGTRQVGKKCPAVEFFGVAQSPKSSYRRDKLHHTRYTPTFKKFYEV